MKRHETGVVELGPRPAHALEHPPARPARLGNRHRPLLPRPGRSGALRGSGTGSRCPTCWPDIGLHIERSGPADFPAGRSSRSTGVGPPGRGPHGFRRGPGPGQVSRPAGATGRHTRDVAPQDERPSPPRADPAGLRPVHGPGGPPVRRRRTGRAHRPGAGRAPDDGGGALGAIPARPALGLDDASPLRRRRDPLFHRRSSRAEPIRVYSRPVTRDGKVEAVVQSARPLERGKAHRWERMRTLLALSSSPSWPPGCWGATLTGRTLRPVRKMHPGGRPDRRRRSLPAPGGHRPGRIRRARQRSTA